MLARRLATADTARSQAATDRKTQPAVVYKQPPKLALLSQLAKTSSTVAANTTSTAPVKAKAGPATSSKPSKTSQPQLFVYGSSQWIMIPPPSEATLPLPAAKTTKSDAGSSVGSSSSKSTATTACGSWNGSATSDATTITSSPARKCVCGNRYKKLARGARGEGPGREAVEAGGMGSWNGVVNDDENDLRNALMGSETEEGRGPEEEALRGRSAEGLPLHCRAE
ncbi:hypothetical protein Q7P37_001336 [Cladosporium fusiforme]